MVILRFTGCLRVVQCKLAGLQIRLCVHLCVTCYVYTSVHATACTTCVDSVSLNIFTCAQASAPYSPKRQKNCMYFLYSV